ncbi:borealin-related [Bombus vancouverensis nearcticus]|uniref:Borealin n=1 Tax=Bombus bifarius TaxID=103933 RepID=A0A6P8ND73_9HYME|nr:borealin [Bombus vancouverensis nearcticus]XP_033319118.1 borealin [Bombus bifarius]
MPRTKHVRKPKQEQHSAEESDLLIKDFERQAHLRISKLEAESKMAIKGLETFVDVTLSRLPTEIRQMTLGEILNREADEEKENCNEVSSSVDDRSLKLAPTEKRKKVGKRITNGTDDGYVTESVTTTRTSRARKVAPPTTRRTRSTSRNSKMKLSEINLETIRKITKKEHINNISMKIDKFRTPAATKPGFNEFDLVTPKIKPNTPLNVLRRPRQGEMVLSMQGSPLLVSAVIQEDIANINVPLRNGNVMSLLPNDGLRMSHIPTLDAETMKQLETLKNHIEKVISTK